ncbi:MAG: tropinone reductase [Bacteroidota bacterium]|nr:tropinone reductase [Bacteroidota bacterium]
MNKNWNLEGRKALVTGGTKGIGRAIVEEFLSLGAEVLLIASNEEEVNRTTSDLKAIGTPVFGMKADVTKHEDIENVQNFIENCWGRLDILVNNAGTNIRRNTMDYTDEEYEFLININLTSIFRICRKLNPLLQKSGNATIVNIGSVAGHRVVRTGSAYASAKAGLSQLTAYLAVEWAENCIRVNSIEPWYIRTPLTEPVLSNEKSFERIIERTPMKRVGIPEDIARTAAFLCMPASGFITGQNLLVDGGASIALLFNP